MRKYFGILLTFLLFFYSYSMIKKTDVVAYKEKIAYTKTSIKGRSSKSVVRISAFDDLNIETMTATGFAVKNIKEKTLILTNYHFCIEAKVFNISVNEIEGTLPIIYEKGIPGEIVLLNKKDDLCLIEIKKKIKPVKLNPKYNQFDKIFVIGNPLGVFPVITDTYISGVISQAEIPFEDNRGDGNLIVISMITLPGHSGSPVFDKSGKVIGVVMASMSPGYGGIVVPSEKIISFLKSY